MKASRAGALVVVVLVLVVIVLTGCSDSYPAGNPATSASGVVSSPSAGPARPASTATYACPTTTIEVKRMSPPPTALALSGYAADGIPQPWVEGGYSYLGMGRFRTDAGDEFFWRAGRFVRADGALLAMPDSVREALAKVGADVTAQPTFYGDAGFATSSLAELPLEDGLRVIMHELSSTGWWVSHVYIEARAPLQVRIVVKVEDNAPGIEATVLQAVGRARARGLPTEVLWLEILEGGLSHVAEYDAQALDAPQE